MWFKQLQLFKLSKSISYNTASFAEQLMQFAFTPCLQNLPSTMGWVAPLEQDHASLVYSSNGCMLICLQTEEKILPAAVVNQKLKEEIKEIEETRENKVSKKERQTIKGSIYYSLLPKAFGKISRLYAYIDTKNNWLILNSASQKKIEAFNSFFKKTLPNISLLPLELKNISQVMTNWLQNDKCPNSLTIENSCVLQDPRKQARIIRCQQQDLFAPSIQKLISESCEVSQMSFTWKDRVTFTLKDDFTLRSLKYQEALLDLAKESATEDEQDQFDADFIIMAETLSELLTDLTKLLTKSKGSD